MEDGTYSERDQIEPILVIFEFSDQNGWEDNETNREIRIDRAKQLILSKGGVILSEKSGVINRKSRGKQIPISWYEISANIPKRAILEHHSFDSLFSKPYEIDPHNAIGATLEHR